MQHFDIAIIGAGSGLIIMEEAVKHGKTVAVIEKGAFGGTCLNRGCIPSKMLVYPADLIREAQSGERVGVSYGEPSIDWEKIERRMRRQIDVNLELAEDIKATKGVSVFEGEGSFVDANTIHIKLKDETQTQISAERVIIAAGSRTRIPHIKGMEETGYQTSESFFSDGFPKKPYKSLLIIGGGSTALEFAHIFSAFGTKVTLAVRSETMLRGMDEDIAPFVKQQLENVGVKVLYFAGAQEMRLEDGQKVMTFLDKKTKETYEVKAEEIFLAPGIVPNSDSLALDKAGIIADADGYIPTDGKLRTNIAHIFAIGDINGKFPLRHKANYEAETLNNILFSDDTRQARYDAVPQAVFTHPQVGSVGLSEKEAREKYGDKVRVFHGAYSDIIAGISMGYSKKRDDDGFAKIITDDEKRILGAHVVGPQAAMIVQPYAYLMAAGGHAQAGAPGTWLPIEQAMTIHPTFSELAAWALIYPHPPKG